MIETAGDPGSCLIVRVLELDAQFVHRIKDETERLDDIGKDDGLPLQLLILAETLGIY